MEKMGIIVNGKFAFLSFDVRISEVNCFNLYIYFSMQAFLPALMAILCQLQIKMLNNFEEKYQPRLIQMSDYDSPITVLHVNEHLIEIMKEFGNISKETSKLRPIMDTAHITKWLWEMGEDDLETYRRDYIVGGEFFRIDLEKLVNESNGIDIEKYINFPAYVLSKNTSTLMNKKYRPYPNVTIMNGLYNSIAVHSRPLASNLISNTLLGHLDVSGRSRRIAITNHPLPVTWTVNFKFLS